jgi:hypothetical protein
VAVRTDTGFAFLCDGMRVLRFGERWDGMRLIDMRNVLEECFGIGSDDSSRQAQYGNFAKIILN